MAGAAPELLRATMGNIYSLTPRRAVRRHPNRALHFTRSELHQLLTLYSRRVACGEWRDYAIDQDGGLAAFSVFRHSHERPLYTITKRWSSPRQSVEYLVLRNHRRLAEAACLDEALSAIEGRLQIVS
jgi:hypothetical protein